MSDYIQPADEILKGFICNEVACRAAATHLERLTHTSVNPSRANFFCDRHSVGVRTIRFRESPYTIESADNIAEGFLTLQPRCTECNEATVGFELDSVVGYLVPRCEKHLGQMPSRMGPAIRVRRFL